MKIALGFLAFLLSSLTLLSQTFPGSLDRYLQGIHNLNFIPGFSVVVVKGDKVIFSKGYGVERAGVNKPFTPATAVAVGSITKSFTALAVMRLAEKGKLNLDDHVIKYLPWFHTANREQSNKITIRMLLNNTSGLYSPNSTHAYDLSDSAIENVVKDLSSIYLYKEPGNSYEYSNTGFVVAGLLISKVSGMSYASFLEKEIFIPLGMKHTTTMPDHFAGMDISYGHYPSIKSLIVAKREPEFESIGYAPAGALLQSCGDDMGKYLVALLNENGVASNLIKKELWTPQIGFPGLSKEDGGDGKSFSYGLGWMVSNIEGKNIIHHGGSTGKTSSFTMIDTANKIAATILMNIDMTFIDKYAYPTEVNILNNVLRLTANLSVSEFARPVGKDLTRNNFELKESSRINYEGEYHFKKGGDAFVNFGVDLKIQKTAGGQLEGIVYRGKQIVNRFDLDFVNESLAVSRNVYMPEFLKFKLTPGGEITSAFFYSTEYDKNKNEESTFKQVTDVYGLASFNLPQAWKFNSGKFDFSASAGNNKAWISGGTISKEKFSFDAIFKSSCDSSARLTAESRMLTDNMGTLIWQQKTYAYKKNNQEFQSMILFTNSSGNGYWFALTSSKADFTIYVQQVVHSLMKSFRTQ